MNKIQNLFQQAQLAEAAYANFWNSGTNSLITDPDLVKTILEAKGFSSTQATAFVAKWTVGK